MACKTESKTIGDTEFSVTQWPAEKSMLMKMRLAKAVGPALAKLAAFDDKKTNKNQQLTGASDAISILFKDNSPEEVTKLIKDCVVGVSRNGEIVTESGFNQHFSGDSLSDVYKVFFFVISVNYRNFIKGQYIDKMLAKVNLSG
jgi:hypothetical protein